MCMGTVLLNCDLELELAQISDHNIIGLATDIIL